MHRLNTRFILPAAAISVAMVALMLPSTSATAVQPRVVVAGAEPIPANYSVVQVAISTTFDIALAQPDPIGESQFIASLSNRASANYHHYLTTAQFASRFGASTSTLASVRSYMQSFGIHVGGLSAGRVILHLSGTTSDIAHAFATTVETVRSTTGALGAQFASKATLPKDIANDIQGIYGLSTVVPKSTSLALANATANAVPGTCADAQAGSPGTSTVPNAAGGYTVQQQASLYGFTGAYASGNIGTGQTIGVYELGAFNQSDLNTYFNCYGLSPTIANTNVGGGATGGFSNEATLDIEEAAALAPGAKIQVYTGPNSGSGPLDIYQNIADENIATIVTTSWGGCEIDPANNLSAEQVIFEQMAAQGQTVISAAGDSGSSDCHGNSNNPTNAVAVDDPSSQPFVTSVGGLSVSNTTPLSQSVWNSNGSGGGGGISQVWSRPSWQVTTGATASLTMRMVPDLSVMADPKTGFMQYYTGTNSGIVPCYRACTSGWSTIGGTSIGAPLISALVAVAAQSCGIARLGFINPALYQMNTAGTGFIDVTSGSNDVFGIGSYNAGPGYDMASGLGSPNGASFISGLCPPKASAIKSSFSAGSPSTTIGVPVTVTLTLRDVNGNPIVNSPVAVSAKETSGVVLINRNSATATTSGNASDTVTTSVNGTITFEISSDTPGTVIVSATSGGVSVGTTTVSIRQNASPAPTIKKLTALLGGFSLLVTPPATGTVTAYQYSINGGATWVNFSSKGSVTVSKLLKSKLYSVIVRALGSGGTSKVSVARSVITLK